MKYHNVDLNLSKFHKDPFADTNVISKLKSSRFTKIKNSIFNVFGKRHINFSSFFLSCIENVNISSKWKGTLENKENEDYFFEKLYSFFSLAVRVDNCKANSAGYRAAIDDYVKRQILIFYGHHSDRIIELFPNEYSHFKLLDNPNLWCVFILSELYALKEIGILDVKCTKYGFKFFCSEGMETDYRKYYFLSEILEDQTKKADDQIFLAFSSKMSFSYVPKQLKDLITEHVLDKGFSLQSRFLSEDLLLSKPYCFLKEIALFLGIIYCFKVRKESVSPDIFYQNDLISLETLNYLRSEILLFSRVKKEPYFPIVIDNNRLKFIDVDFKIGVRVFFSNLMERKKSIDKSSVFSQGLGKLFEQNYVFLYLSSLKNNRFKVYPEINPGASTIKGYDIDMVLEDTLFNCFYFIQTKHRSRSVPTFWSERVIEVSKHLEKGIEQLKVFRDNINEPSIRDKLKQKKYKGLERANENNSHYILLHNMPFLNIYKSDGILFYEWNLFRNIIQNTKTTWATKDHVGENESSPVPIHELDKVWENYVTDQEIRGNVKEQYQVFLDTVCRIKYQTPSGDTQIEFPLF